MLVADGAGLRGLAEVPVGAGPEALTYHRGGTADPPLVLLNALGQGLAPWSELVDRLLPRRLLLWEMRGCSPPHRPLSVADHVDDLARILAAEAVRSCHLVGWCTGPKLALAFQQRHPQVVRSLVFLNAAFKHPGRDPALDTAYERDLEALCRAVDRRPGNAGRLRQLFQPGQLGQAPASALAAAVRKPFSSEPALLAYARQHLDFWSYDPLPEVPELTVPVLLIAGERDEIVAPAGVREAARWFRRARYEEIPGGSHYALFELPDRVAALIEDFLDSPPDIPW